MATHESEDSRKKQILNSALTCFSNGGLDKVTIEDIAKEAGLSKGTIYLYYKSKDELIYALCEAWCKISDQAMFKMAVECDLDRMIYEFPQYLFRQTQLEKHHKFFFQLWARSVDNEQLRGRLTAMHKEHHAKSLDLLRTALSKKLLKEDVDIELLAITIHALFDGLLIQWHFDPEIDLEKCWKNAIDNLRFGIGLQHAGGNEET